MQCSGVEEIWGGSVYDPAYYTFLFEETQTNMNSPKLYWYGKGAHISSFSKRIKWSKRWKGHWKLLELKSKAAKFWERKVLSSRKVFQTFSIAFQKIRY
ncbi:hypothetical protein F2Q69_00035418 [Brassica cretica]|uniref:Uncharacterized protein n=1 Tax=Brassica cretica TaxID=69181 RepID=A0A8S9SIM2_BRACR|nr:hypothetical protein F2Q69_00035418 [Brassica cretica]